MSLDEDKAHYIAVTGIIIKEGKYLITKRSKNESHFPGKWTVPGGKLEQKDYKEKQFDTNAGQWYNILETLLRREVREETGLDIKNIKYLANLVFERKDNIPVVVISLFADHDKGEVMLNHESDDYKWVTLEEAKNYDLIDGIYEEIEMLDNHLKGEKIGEWKKNS